MLRFEAVDSRQAGEFKRAGGQSGGKGVKTCDFLRMSKGMDGGVGDSRATYGPLRQEERTVR